MSNHAAGGGLWVPPGHFYSPLVESSDVHVMAELAEEAKPSKRPADLGLDDSELLRWFEIATKYYPESPFPAGAREGARYFYVNPHFPLADAIALMAIMLQVKPARYVEVGCGHSSCAAIDVNETYLDGTCQMTFIDPYPNLFLDLIGVGSQYAKGLRPMRIQDAPLDMFTELSPGDILFIDSSHVGKTGSDVLDYMFRILPALAPGVLIHVHDIFYPFEYPTEWVVKENRSWNEAYLLRAFLHGTRNYRVIYFSDWYYKCHRDLVCSQMPLCIEHRGGSLWLEKRAS